ncbi:MAG: hypothetical protein R2873_36190 [Caldilineaceae bacterium]
MTQNQKIGVIVVGVLVVAGLLFSGGSPLGRLSDPSWIPSGSGHCLHRLSDPRDGSCGGGGGAGR